MTQLTGTDWKMKISRFLLTQHTTPSTVTGRTPAEILMNRKIKTAFDLLHSNFVSEMQAQQEKKFPCGVCPQ